MGLVIQAAIFDLDGTVLDNESIWEEVFREVAVKNRINSHALEYGSKWIHEPGIGISPNWERLVKDHDQVSKLSQQTWALYAKKSELNLRSGIVELVEAIKERGWQTALATGSEWHVVEKELEELNLYLAFDVTTTGEEVLAQKPDPEIYLLTAQKLGVDPQECGVVEDSLAGVQAAVEAGMTVVGITSAYASRQELTQAGVKLVVDNLNEVVLGLSEHELGRKME